MRLINVHTLEFCEFFERETPPYAILSHRWCADEITYKDFLNGRKQSSEGYRKVSEFCAFVRRFHLSDDSADNTQPVDWIWVDTCCIDKKSSAELSEAINAMYRYYQEACLCVVYLADLACQDGETARESLQRCSWFWRGWTLQELIAPKTLIFCDSRWSVYGILKGMDYVRSLPFTPSRSVSDLLHDISAITKIPEACLTGETAPGAYSIAQRMIWAANRSTTRTKDEVYCLLGIFHVNMPLIYGEGVHAFQRLQEEIIRRTRDQSILAWSRYQSHSRFERILARSPKNFADSVEICPGPDADVTLWNITNLGLEMHSSLLKPRSDQPGESHAFFLELNCTRPADSSGAQSSVMLSLYRTGWRDAPLFGRQFHEADNAYAHPLKSISFGRPFYIMQ